MDRAYQGDIPWHRKTLTGLKREFSRLKPATDWNKLRIEPLLAHVAELERRLRSSRFSGKRVRLRRGVGIFRSDLVYLRTNIAGLKKILADEKRRAANRVRK